MALFVTIGGALGGFIASRWPDVLEPAVCPNHRQLAHSVTTGSCVLTYAAQAVPEWESYWRGVAINTRGLRLDPMTPVQDLFSLQARELLAWLFVGLSSGVAAGYLSHLALDGFTPAGLPLVGLYVAS